MAIEVQDSGRGDTFSRDLRADIGNATGLWMVYIWVGVSTTGAASAVQVEGTAIDRLGCTNLLSSSVGSVTLDGSSSNAKTFTWLVDIDSSSTFTVDFSYFSPFSDLRYDYAIWLCDPR